MGILRLTKVVAAAACLAACTIARAEPSRNAFDAAALEAFFDEAAAERMAAGHVPGLVVVVTDRNGVLFQKGYGVVDLDSGRPVDPERTVFRIGSITKVFTAVALMQQADRGTVDLHADVNRYLTRTRAPETWPGPITSHHLMTHTSGLDEISPGRWVTDPARLLPLETFLSTRLVRRAPAGGPMSYSTYNAALAGLLVEDVTGRPLRDYVADEILRPLGMDRSSFSYVPAAHAPDMAVGYEYEDGRQVRMDYEWFHTFPASDINSTGADMAKFLIANLQPEGLGRRLMRPESLRAMHRRQASSHPAMPGWGYGVYQDDERGMAGFGHGGSMNGFNAVLYFAPEQGVGLFIAANGSAPISLELKSKFLESFFPAGPGRAIPPETGSPALNAFAGTYRIDSWCHSCPPEGRGWVPPPMVVTVEGDQLRFLGALWVRRSATVFEKADGSERLAFRLGSDGRAAYAFVRTDTLAREADAQ